LPREFPATRYDWNNQHATNTSSFPHAASHPSQSTSQRLPNVNRLNRDYRPPLSHSTSGNMPMNPEIFSQVSSLQSRLSSLPDMNKTLELLTSLVNDLENAKSHHERIMVFVKSAEANSRPFPSFP
jgi:hypothetical protein